MGASPLYPGYETLGSKAAELTRWLRGDFLDPDGQQQIRDAINDAVGSIWTAMMQVKLLRFISSDSPVTFTLNQGTQHLPLVSLANPSAAPTLAFGSQGNLDAHSPNVGVTWVTDSGSETLMSPIASNLNIPQGSVLVVNPASIPNIPVSPTTPPFVNYAIGYNVYAGSQATTIGLQNQQPIPFNQTWTEPNTGIIDWPGSAAPPAQNTTADDIAWIEHMETLLPDGTYRSWNQADIDSNVMRRLAGVFPNASQYQTIAWDLINGNILEVRPTPGITFTSRYWWVAKPRKMRYDQARIPYTEITSVSEYIKWAALASCKLSIDEYLAFQAFDGKAGQLKTEIQVALLQEGWAKDVRVVPYLW